MNSRQILTIDYLIAIAILVTTFLSYLHNFIPDTNTWNILFFEFEKPEGYSYRVISYHTLLLLSYVCFYAIWYLCCEYWWKFMILIIFAFSVYRFEAIIIDFYAADPRMNQWAQYGIILTAILLLYAMERWLNYPFRQRIQSDIIDSEEILKYRLKSHKQYKRMLSKLQDEATKSDMQSMKHVLTRSILEIENAEPVGLKNIKLNLSHRGTIAAMIALSIIPLIDHANRLVDQGVKKLDLGFIVIGNFGFYDFATFLWFFGIKSSLFIGLTAWFISCRYWWKYFLMVPITMLCYQMFNILNPKIERVGENEILHALPVLAVIVMFLVWVSYKIKNHNKINEIKNRIEVEIFKIISFIANADEEQSYQGSKTRLRQVIENKEKFKPEEYLRKLEEIQNKLTKKNTP